MKQAFAAASLALLALAGPVLADGSAEDGEQVFKKCKACHQVGDNAKNRTGPVLNGVVGAAAGAVDGYKYSKPLLAAAEGGLVWTEENLDAWLADPSGFLKEVTGDSKARSKMTLKLADEDDRENVIAYLGSL